MEEGYNRVLETSSNTEALQTFEDLLYDAADSFEERYGEELGIQFKGPVAHSFPGPAAGTTVSNFSEYRIEGYDRAQDIRVDLEDLPYHVEEIVDEEGFNLGKFMEAFQDFDSGRARSRVAKLSPEGSIEEDLWFCFTREVANVVEPERLSLVMMSTTCISLISKTPARRTLLYLSTAPWLI